MKLEGEGVPVHQPGWALDVQRLCALDVTLLPTNDIVAHRGDE